MYNFRFLGYRFIALATKNYKFSLNVLQEHMSGILKKCLSLSLNSYLRPREKVLYMVMKKTGINMIHVHV